MDTKLKQYSGGDDDAFINFWILITSGTENAVARRVKPTSGYTDSTGTLTPAAAFATQIASGVTYELHRTDPTNKNNAIARAIEELFGSLYLPVRDETIVVGDRLANSDFETGTFTSWTSVGAPTLTAETTIVRHGSQSAKIAAGAALGQLTQTPTINVDRIIGVSITFKMWVYATAASVARLGLDFGNGVVQYSSYHTGNSDWELLSISAAVPTAGTQVKVSCDVAANGTAYFDAGYCYTANPQLLRYTIPTTILRGPNYVTIQADEYDPLGAYYPVRYPVNGMRLRLEGLGILTSPASDTATVEVSAPQMNLIVAKALENLAEINFGGAGAQQRVRFQEDITLAQGKRKQLDRMMVRTVRLGAQNSGGRWQVQEDGVGGNRYLVFQGARWDSIGSFQGFR